MNSYSGWAKDGSSANPRSVARSSSDSGGVDNRQRQHLAHLGNLAHDGLEARVHEVQGADTRIGILVQETFEQDGRHLTRGLGGRRIRLPFPLAFDVNAAEAEVRRGPATKGVDDGLVAVLTQVRDELLRFAQDGRRVGSGHTAIRCHDQDGHAIGVFAFLGQRVVEVRVDRDAATAWVRAFS